VRLNILDEVGDNFAVGAGCDSFETGRIYEPMSVRVSLKNSDILSGQLEKYTLPDGDKMTLVREEQAPGAVQSVSPH
jgi:hypothetical protein